MFHECSHGFKRGKPQEEHMATLEITEPMFAETIEQNELVLLDFWAEWCGPCRAYGPVYERVSEEFPDVVFGKIDTEDQQALAGMFGIRSIPTTIAFKEGIGVFMQPGALPEDALRDLVGKLQELNMDEVRAELEAHESEKGEDA
jgi:thioredoxin